MRPTTPAHLGAVLVVFVFRSDLPLENVSIAELVLRHMTINVFVGDRRTRVGFDADRLPKALFVSFLSSLNSELMFD